MLTRSLKSTTVHLRQCSVRINISFWKSSQKVHWPVLRFKTIILTSKLFIYTLQFIIFDSSKFQLPSHCRNHILDKFWNSAGSSNLLKSFLESIAANQILRCEFARIFSQYEPQVSLLRWNAEQQQFKGVTKLPHRHFPNSKLPYQKKMRWW